MGSPRPVPRGHSPRSGVLGLVQREHADEEGWERTFWNTSAVNEFGASKAWKPSPGQITFPCLTALSRQVDRLTDSSNIRSEIRNGAQPLGWSGFGPSHARVPQRDSQSKSRPADCHKRLLEVRASSQPSSESTSVQLLECKCMGSWRSGRWASSPNKLHFA